MNQAFTQQDDNDIIWQLTDGYWGAEGRRKFDLGPDKMLTVNLSGLSRDRKYLVREALDTWATAEFWSSGDAVLNSGIPANFRKSGFCGNKVAQSRTSPT